MGLLGALAVASSAWGAEASAPVGVTEELGAAEPNANESAASGSVSVAALTGAEALRAKSGLPVLLQPNTGAPEVTVCTAVAAGVNEDPSGALGTARVVADMVARGGYRSGDRDDAALLESRGVSSALSMMRDVVTFCSTAPARELPLLLWTAAGRFSRQAVTSEGFALALERMGERAEREAEDAFGHVAPDRLRRMALLGNERLAHPSLPNSSELGALEFESARDFHAARYVASRSAVAIVGGVDVEVAKRLVREQLDYVPAGAATEPSTRAKGAFRLAPQTTQRFSMIESPDVTTPAVWYGWVAPEAEREELSTLVLALASQKRLAGKIVGKSARSLTVHLPETSELDLVRLEIVGSGPQSLGTIEKALDDELRAVQANPPSEAEIADARSALALREQSELSTAEGRARALARGALHGKEPSVILAPLASAERASPEFERAALGRLAQTRLGRYHRSIVEVYPKGWQDPWQTPMPVYHLISPGETLSSIAKQHKTTVEQLTKMNGMAATKTLFPGEKLKVPRGAASQERALRTHQVRRGDTLSALAVKYGVSARAIAEENGMTVKQPIQSGETLRIPWSSGNGGGASSSGESSGGGGAAAPPKEADKSAPVTHVVKPGETLGGIAVRYGVRLGALASANGLTVKSMVQAGRELVIPRAPSDKAQNQVDAKAPATKGDKPAQASSAKTTKYIVQSGDTLSGIAKRHGVGVTDLERANGISRKATLRAGQKLEIPAK